jgi:hypothetical protein
MDNVLEFVDSLTKRETTPKGHAQNMGDTIPMADRDLVGGHTPPYYRNKKERPHQRAIAFMAASGMSHKEISDQLGFSPAAIAAICRQPWARQLIVEEIRKAGRDTVREVLQSAALDSVFKLIEIRDKEECQPETQRKAACDLLDRVYGKPNQPITHTSKVELDKLTDEELATIIADNGKARN